MRKLQTDEQWAAVVILPSELTIFYFCSILCFWVYNHCMFRQNLDVPAACKLQTSRWTMMNLGCLLMMLSLSLLTCRLHSIMVIDQRYLHTNLFSNLKKIFCTKRKKIYFSSWNQTEWSMETQGIKYCNGGPSRIQRIHMLSVHLN